MNFKELILYFFIYAFLGWCTEVSFATLKTGKFVNRGFLNGPICSIYGFGMILVLLLLNPLRNKLFLLFIFSILVATFLEFVTGFVLEKFFHRKWWDYSNEPFNIKGYICLRFSIIWGLCCVFVISIIHPLIEKLVHFLPNVVSIILIVIFIVYYIIDNIVTILQIIKYSKFTKELTEIKKILRLSSDKIGEKVSDTTLALIKKSEVLLNKIKKSRLVKAFPRLNHDNNDNNDKNK